MSTLEKNGAPLMRAVATDGHRLASMEIPLPVGAEGMFGVILPRKAVTELRELLEDADGDVEVALSDTKARPRWRDHDPLIDGTFPITKGLSRPATTRTWKWTACSSTKRSTGFPPFLGQIPRVKLELASGA